MGNDEATEYLCHYGVLGMKWGVRRYQPYGQGYSGSKGRFVGKSRKDRKFERQARKDAKEFARAKMYYGEGAGTRRKLIKATVQERSKNKTYKDAFDKALDAQDMSEHAKKAKRERKSTDAKNAAKMHVRGAINIANGNAGRAAASTLAIVTLASAIHSSGLDKAALEQGRLFVDKMRWINYMNSL